MKIGLLPLSSGSDKRDLELKSLNKQLQYNELIIYRQELRNLPSKEGFPWDGGGELTPWPIKPV